MDKRFCDRLIMGSAGNAGRCYIRFREKLRPTDLTRQKTSFSASWTARVSARNGGERSPGTGLHPARLPTSSVNPGLCETVAEPENETRRTALKEHQTTIRVRYDDADPGGYLHHSRYFTFFEIGRTELFRAAGGNYREMEQAGLFVVVVKAECQFVRPARYDDLVTIRTTITKLSTAKIEHEYVATRDDEVLAKAKVTLAVVDRTGRVQPVPNWIEELYQA